jgi:hypothetical protein
MRLLPTSVHQYVDPRCPPVVMTAARAPIKPLRIHRSKRIVGSPTTLQPQLRPRSAWVHRILVLPHSRPRQRSIGDVVGGAVVFGPFEQALCSYSSRSLGHLSALLPTEGRV